MNLRIPLFVILCFSLGLSAYADVEIALEPEIESSKNLLKEDAWSFGDHYAPERRKTFEARRDDAVFYTEPDSLYIKANSIEYSGYWSQVVQVDPGKQYFMFVRFKHENARILIWLSGRAGKLNFDQRIYALLGQPNFLVPVFLKPEHVGANSEREYEWDVLARSVTIPKDMSLLRVSLGSYFGSGEVWFDEAYFGQGIPKLRLKGSGLQPGDRVTVEMASTRDVLLTKNIEDSDAAIDVLLEDTRADESYIIRVQRADGSVIIRHYPFKQQALIVG